MSEYTPTTEEVRNNLVLMMEKPREVTPEEFERWLAGVERAAAARALEDAAESFRVNTWLDLLKPAGGMPGLTRNATAITNWLRARAAEIREGKNE